MSGRTEVTSVSLKTLTPHPTPSRDRAHINLTYLVRLRWGAFAGQAGATLWVRAAHQLDLPVRVMFALISLGALSNLALMLWARSVPPPGDRTIAWVMALDAALLTLLLALSGGPSNPFSTFYLVNVALGAVLLPATLAWGIAALGLVGFALLFPLAEVPGRLGLHTPGHAEMMPLHLEGMWVAFLLSTAFIVFFVRRVQRANETLQAELTAAQDLQHRQVRLASLGTLAAGAAHELATPLSTIAVVVAELESALAQDSTSAAELGLVRTEVERCRSILRKLSTTAGQPMGEALVAFTLADWFSESLVRLGATERVRVWFDASVQPLQVRGPREALVSALSGLLKNALEAQSPEPPTLEAKLEDGQLLVVVKDAGRGMDAETLARAGEPFFTTKGPDAGMGLGLFLSRTLMEQLGGTLRLASMPNRGTQATLVLPLTQRGTTLGEP